MDNVLNKGYKLKKLCFIFQKLVAKPSTYWIDIGLIIVLL